MVTLNDIEQEFKIIKLSYPSLSKLSETTRGFCISGTLSIIDANGWDWGTYHIEIWIHKTFPLELPLLVETKGDIERHIDWHISKNGICCVGTLARQYRDMSDGVSI